MTFDDERIRPAEDNAADEKEHEEGRRERRAGSGGIAGAAGAAGAGVGVGAGLGAVAGDELLDRLDETAEAVEDTTAGRGEQIVRERIAEAEAALQAASLDVFESEAPAVELPESVRDAAGIIGDTLPPLPGRGEQDNEFADGGPAVAGTPGAGQKDVPVDGAPSIPGSEGVGAGVRIPASPEPPGPPSFSAPPGAPSIPNPPPVAPPSGGPPAAAPAPPPDAPTASAPTLPDAPSSPDVPAAPASPGGADAGPSASAPSIPDAPATPESEGETQSLPQVPAEPDQPSSPDTPAVPSGPVADSGSSSSSGSETAGTPGSSASPTDSPATSSPGSSAGSPSSGSPVPVHQPDHDTPSYGEHDAQPGDYVTYPYVTEWHAEGGWAQVAVQNNHGQVHLFRYYTDGRVYYIDDHGNAHPVDENHVADLLYIGHDGTAYFSKPHDGDTVYFAIDTDGGIERVDYEDIPVHQNGEIVDEYEYPRTVAWDADEGWAIIQEEHGGYVKYYDDGTAHLVDNHGNYVVENGIAPIGHLLYVDNHGNAYFRDGADGNYTYFMIDHDGGIEYVDPQDIPDYDYEPVEDDYEPVLPENAPAYFEHNGETFPNPELDDSFHYVGSPTPSTYRFENDEGYTIIIGRQPDGSYNILWGDLEANDQWDLGVNLAPDGGYTILHYHGEHYDDGEHYVAPPVEDDDGGHQPYFLDDYPNPFYGDIEPDGEPSFASGVYTQTYNNGRIVVTWFQEGGPYEVRYYSEEGDRSYLQLHLTYDAADYDYTINVYPVDYWDHITEDFTLEPIDHYVDLGYLGIPYDDVTVANTTVTYVWYDDAGNPIQTTTVDRVSGTVTYQYDQLYISVDQYGNQSYDGTPDPNWEAPEYDGIPGEDLYPPYGMPLHLAYGDNEYPDPEAAGYQLLSAVPADDPAQWQFVGPNGERVIVSRLGDGQTYQFAYQPDPNQPVGTWEMVIDVATDQYGNYIQHDGTGGTYYDEYNQPQEPQEPQEQPDEDDVLEMIPDWLPETFEDGYPNPETSDQFSFSHYDGNYYYFTNDEGTYTIRVYVRDSGGLNIAWYDAPLDGLDATTVDLVVDVTPDGQAITEYYPAGHPYPYADEEEPADEEPDTDLDPGDITLADLEAVGMLAGLPLPPGVNLSAVTLQDAVDQGFIDQTTANSLADLYEETVNAAPPPEEPEPEPAEEEEVLWGMGGPGSFNIYGEAFPNPEVDPNFHYIPEAPEAASENAHLYEDANGYRAIIVNNQDGTFTLMYGDNPPSTAGMDAIFTVDGVSYAVLDVIHYPPEGIGVEQPEEAAEAEPGEAEPGEEQPVEEPEEPGAAAPTAPIANAPLVIEWYEGFEGGWVRIMHVDGNTYEYHVGQDTHYLLTPNGLVATEQFAMHDLQYVDAAGVAYFKQGENSFYSVSTGGGVTPVDRGDLPYVEAGEEPVFDVVEPEPEEPDSVAVPAEPDPVDPAEAAGAIVTGTIDGVFDTVTEINKAIGLGPLDPPSADDVVGDDDMDEDDPTP